MDAGVAFLVGAAATAIVAAPTILVLRRRYLGEKTRRAGRSHDAEVADEILAAAPVGFLLWYGENEVVRCSRRLAVLLELPDGTDSGYGAVLACFKGDTADRLDRNVGKLRRHGRGFDISLALEGNGRTVQVVGVRALHGDDRTAADVLWFRDVTGINGTPANGHNKAASHDLRALVSALPFPAWIRDGEGAVHLANRAASEAEQQQTETGFTLLSADGVVLEVSEVPLGDGATTLGLALPEAKAVPAVGKHGENQDDWFSILETLPIPIALFGKDTRLAFSNQRYAQLWELDADWLAAGPRMGDLLDRLRETRRLPEVPDYPAFCREQLAQFYDLDGPAQTMMHLPDGSTLRSVVSPRPGGGLVVAYEDLSERLSLERSLNELNAVQRETLDNLFEGIAVFGGDGRLRLHNPAFRELWELGRDAPAAGIHVSAFVQKAVSFLPDDGPSDGTDVLTSGGLMSREPKNGRISRADGRVLEYATVPLPDGAVLVSFLDVTDDAKVERALRQRAEALDAANRLKSEFIANVSYEIRTPLTTLSGFAEILTEQYFGELNRRQMEYAHGIVETSRSLMSVVGDILDLAGIEAGMMALELDTVDVHTLLAGILKLVRQRARKRNLKIEFDCPPDIGWIVADERRLKQVFFNLMSNAVRFTPRKGRVGLSAKRKGGEVIIAVSDSGPGIERSEIERLTQPFERGTAGEADGQGAGLGLSLVSRFIELHDGNVEIRSASGRGTTVTCRLPTGEAAAESHAGPS
ncbi:MAG: PAS-domain containing protein [Rhodospirillales bacterium]|nr:PAS-domain containing protein [Rhodospirillales bacterium]